MKCASGLDVPWRASPVVEVRLAEEAEAEYREALAWYHIRSPRAADGFEAAFAKAVERIADSPDQFPACEGEGFRFAMLGARYPYSLIFRIIGAAAEIVAVAHARRRPGYWSDRR